MAPLLLAPAGMIRLAATALLALAAGACSNHEAPSSPAGPTATLAPALRNDVRAPDGVSSGDALSSPPPMNAQGATPPSLSAPKPACAVMARGECHPTPAAACAAIACPSEMCVTSGEQPATVRCQR